MRARIKNCLGELNLNIFTVAPAPQAQGKQDEEGLRDSAVVDGILQEQNFLLVNTLPASPSFALKPVTVTCQPATGNFPITQQIAP